MRELIKFLQIPHFSVFHGFLGLVDNSYFLADCEFEFQITVLISDSPALVSCQINSKVGDFSMSSPVFFYLVSRNISWRRLNFGNRGGFLPAEFRNCIFGN